MILVLYVCGIGLPITEKDGVPSINGCLGGGLTLATIVWCLGNVSGGHINPAISVAFLFSGKLNLVAAIFYVGFQLLGGMSGAYLLKSIIPDESLINATVTTIHPELTPLQGFGIEFIITFILALTIFACVDSKRKDIHGSFPLSIGLAIVIGGLFGGPFTGGSMNPARSFGPALASGIWDHHWVYWLGPIGNFCFRKYRCSCDFFYSKKT
jgi:MIP family channel proteins